MKKNVLIKVLCGTRWPERIRDVSRHSYFAVKEPENFLNRIDLGWDLCYREDRMSDSARFP